MHFLRVVMHLLKLLNRTSRTYILIIYIFKTYILTTNTIWPMGIITNAITRKLCYNVGKISVMVISTQNKTLNKSDFECCKIQTCRNDDVYRRVTSIIKKTLKIQFWWYNKQHLNKYTYGEIWTIIYLWWDLNYYIWTYKIRIMLVTQILFHCY